MLASTAARKRISLWSKFFQDELNEGRAHNCTLLKTFLILKKKKKKGDIFIHISSWKLLGKMLLKSHHLQACNYQILEQKTHGQRTSKNTFIEIKNWGTAIVWNGSRTAGNGNSHNTLSDFTCLWSYQTDLKIQRLINLAAENIKLG